MTVRAASPQLRVLVLPQQFPRDAHDLAGVFSLDYIAAIKDVCQVTVLRPGDAQRPGVARFVLDGVEHVTYTPRLRGGGETRQRLGRLESLYALGRLESSLPPVDVIHAHGPVFHGVPALQLGRRLGVPVVLTVHTPLEKVLRRATTRFLARRTLEGVACVCPVSDDLRRQIRAAGFAPRRVEVTYNPVDTDLFRAAPRPASPRRRLLFAGRLEEYKGGLRTLRAFAAICERWPEWTLAIAGDGPELPAIVAFLRDRPAVAARVELRGPCSRADLAELFAGADCLVYPSRHETFGLVLAEAMSAGLPVIAPDRTAPPEFVDESSGLLVPPDDVDAIADAIDQVLANLSSYRPERIRETVVRRFGRAAFGERLRTLYGELCPAVPSPETPSCAA